MKSKKGITGKVLTVVISLVIALVVLALLWSFLTKAMPLISKAIENTIIGFKRTLCERLTMPFICDMFVGG